jgi:hypothetical protein
MTLPVVGVITDPHSPILVGHKTDQGQGRFMKDWFRRGDIFARVSVLPLNSIFSVTQLARTNYLRTKI